MAEEDEHDLMPALRIQPLMQRAMALGSKPWNRSKVMIVGEGRAGKTALCNSMMGKSFEETESTVGLTQLTCDVRRAAATSDGRWVEHTKPEREFEAGLAQLVRNMESLEPAGKEPLHNTNNEDSGMCLESERTSQSNTIANIAGSLLETPIETTHSSNETKVNGSVPLLKSDMSFVMKYLAEVKVSDAGLILSLFDFGGQSVFNIIHHLFLTSYGVYIVVFNVVDILVDNKREQSLSEMSFWINSIVMHTSKVMSGKIAPIFLVGTHKDYVNDAANFERISQIIEDRFQFHVGWPHIQENKNSSAKYSLCFFPVNNKEGLRDYDVMNLMSSIESVVKEAEYVVEPRPLTWLKALDELLATKKSFVPISEATSLAVANGVEEDAASSFLSFLNEMGVVLWLDEEGLRDVVILDVIAFFVEPATLIICNHMSNPSDCTVHHKSIQEICRKTRAKEWSEMTHRGLVSQPLMEYLLVHKTEARAIPIIINMMLKYGLIVKLEHVPQSHALPPPEYYVVPALLPATEGSPIIFQNVKWNLINNFYSCYFVFSTATDLSNLQSIPLLVLRKECFLPRGLMERLIGKAVKWSQLTNIANLYDDARLYRNYAVLCYGRQQFRLVCIPEINCIRLDIEGEHPLPVYNRIREQISLCAKECMGSLQFITALRQSTSSETETEFKLLNLEAVKEYYQSHISFASNNSMRINDHDIKSMYGAWLVSKDMLPSYDVFISHRWHKEDEELIDQLYDAFLGHVLGSEMRAVNIFLDIVRIRKGQEFQKAFGKALINSTVFLPVVCSSALSRMLSHNPAKEDNVLIEWILALACMQDPTHSKMRGIYPLIFGVRKDDGIVGDIFAEEVIDSLPDIVPTASIEVVCRLLAEEGIDVSSSLSSLTVRSVVQNIVGYNGLLCWEVPANTYCQRATVEIVETLTSLRNKLY